MRQFKKRNLLMINLMKLYIIYLQKKHLKILFKNDVVE